MQNFIKTKLPIVFRYRVWWHVAFWLLIYGMFTISYGGYGNGSYYSEAIINAELLPVRIAFTYLMIYFLLPKFLLKRKFRLFMFGSLLHLFFFGFFIWMMFFFVIHIPGYSGHENYPFFYWSKIFVAAISNAVIPLLAAVVKISKWWYIDQIHKSNLEKEKLAAELKYLKAQIHPHFLFNTLNNLYALTLTKSEKAPEVVLKLSELLDYMLYHSSSEKVSLEKELKVLESYIALEQIRYDERLNLTYNVNGKTTSASVAPLILFPLVENAFKHGASNDCDSPDIEITIQINTKELEMKVVNSLPTHQSTDEKVREGIGLNNVRRQLSLIYPDAHKLEMNKRERTFEAKLSIEII